MMEIQQLELDQILNQIQGFAHTETSKQAILNMEVSYDPLQIQHQVAFAKEVLACTIQYDALPLESLKDVGSILQQVKKGRTLTAMELFQIGQLISLVLTCKKYEENIHEVDHPILKEYIDSLNYHRHLAQDLNQAINQYGEIKQDASAKLLEIQQQLFVVEERLQAVIQQFLQQHKSSIVDSIVTYRNQRAVVLVSASDKNRFDGYVYGDSSSNKASYVEPRSFISYNNQKLSLLDQQQEEIQRILSELSLKVQQHVDELIANHETLILLDVAFSKALWGKQVDGVMGNIVNDQHLYIHQARHPLIDPKKVVANTYEMAKDIHMLLITGPNTGGKTVSLKIIGLFVLMTYLGIPIPCKQADIPLFDHVYADIKDDQSVVSSLSHFSAHIQKQAFILEHATKQSLVLFDEIGNGTDPQEGEALAISILNHLRLLGCKTVATTHYNRLKRYGKRHHDIQVASVGFDEETLLPTYHYIAGVTGSSNAFDVAKRYGLPKSIIHEAISLKQQSKSQEDILIERLEKQLQQVQQDKEVLRLQFSALQQQKEQLLKQQEHFEQEKQEWMDSYQQQAQQYLDEAKQKAKKVLKQIQQEDLKYHQVLQLSKSLQPQQDHSIKKEYSFQVGDVVEIIQSGQVCKIQEISKREITIDFNGRTIKVKPSQIRPSRHVLVTKKPKSIDGYRPTNLFASVPSECHLIGMSVSEGLEALAQYMDQVKLAHLSQVRIIHGDGSGKLRQAVHQYLRKQSQVKSFELAMPSQGGTGATIVHL